MSIYGKPLLRAIAGDKTRHAADLRLAALAFVLLAAVCALLVDRDGVIGGLQGIGGFLESCARLIASVDIPFG